MRRLLTALILSVLSVPLARLHGQAVQTSDQKAPAFEVASVKPTPSERQNRLRPDFCQNGGRFFVAGTPVIWSLTYAYRLKEYQISGTPDWLNRFDSAYDIEGKPASPVDETQCRLMVQSLFVDRFKLRTHRETRETPVYLLTIGKNSQKLREDGEVRLNGGVQINPSGKPDWPNGLMMSELARILSNYTDRPVVDRTGLTGRYGVTLDFSLVDGDGRSSIFTAVEEQLGLKLQPAKAPLFVLVIDHVERPTPD